MREFPAHAKAFVASIKLSQDRTQKGKVVLVKLT